MIVNHVIPGAKPGERQRRFLQMRGRTTSLIKWNREPANYSTGNRNSIVGNFLIETVH